MPDPDPTPAPVPAAPAAHTRLDGWAKILWAAAALVGAIGGVITGVVSIVMQDKQGDRLGNVEQSQVQATATAVEVKEDLEKKAAADAKKAAEERQAKVMQALGTWKWLEQVAIDSGGGKKEMEDAEKARLVYEDLKRKNGSP